MRMNGELCPQGWTSTGAGPDLGDQRQSSGLRDQSATGPEPPAAAWGDSGTGGGQGPAIDHIVFHHTCKHGKKSDVNSI